MGLRTFIREHWLPPFLFYLLTGIYRRYPLTKKSDHNEKALMIVGSGRSGTTLLRSMLWAGNIAACPPECYGLKKCIMTFALYNYMSWPRLTKKCLNIIRYHGDVEETWGINFDKVYQKIIDLPSEHRSGLGMIALIYKEYQLQHDIDTPFWGDKTPNNTMGIHWLRPVFKNAYFIHLIRNGFHVADSYLQNNVSSYQNRLEALQRWKIANRQVESYFRRYEKGGKHIQVKFENLTKDPEYQMTRLYDFLKLPYSPEWKKHNTVFDKMGDTVKYSHHKNVSQPIGSVSKKHMSDSKEKNYRPEELNLVKKEMKHYGYL